MSAKTKPTLPPEVLAKRRKVNKITAIVLGAIAALILALVIPVSIANNAIIEQEKAACVAQMKETLAEVWGDSARELAPREVAICDDPDQRDFILGGE